MRRARAALALAAAAALAAGAAPAGARDQSSFAIVDVVGGGGNVTAVISSLRVSGSVTVDFHGDEAAGCAAVHLCGVTGTVSWKPAGPASVVAFGYRDGGERLEQGFVGIGEQAPLRISARVRRAGASGAPSTLCADVVSQSFSGYTTEARRGYSIELRAMGLPGSSFGVSDNLRTRCAGPMTSDVSALLPGHLIGQHALLEGHRTLDFSADRSFAAHGLAGTVHSTVAMRVLGGERVLNDGSGGFRGLPTHVVRRRAIDVTYQVERVSGRVVTGVRGLADPDLCGPLDACGLMGSVTVSTSAASGEAHVNATASIRHSRRDLRRAVGLSPGPRPRGVSAFGFGLSQDAQGTVTSDLSRDGAPACSDSEPLMGPSTLLFDFSGQRVSAHYGAGSDASGSLGDPLRTRCPGPGLADVAPTGALASADVPLRTFAQRRVTLRLTRGRAYASDGYSGSTRPDVTVVLRRTHVREYVQTERVPNGFPRALARRFR
jgi:uncharacterized protein (DUF2141 family)